MRGRARVRCVATTAAHGTLPSIHSSSVARACRARLSARRRRRARRFRLRRHRHFWHQLQLEQWQVLHWPCTLLGLHSLVHSFTLESPRTLELHGTPAESPSSLRSNVRLRSSRARGENEREEVGRAAYVRLRPALSPACRGWSPLAGCPGSTLVLWALA